MNATRTVQLSARHSVIILLLSVAGGGVDAIMISCFQVLTGAQTGNTVLLAVALAQGRFFAGLYSAVSVAAFILGSIAGELAIIGGKAQPAVRSIRWALAAELLPLAALLVCWHFAPRSPGWQTTVVVIALAAGAMGIQSAAILRIHGSPTTTYVTGTLSKFATDLTMWLFLRQSRARLAKDHDAAPLSSDGRALYGADWLVYLGGGIFSALLYLWVRELALIFPIFAIVAAITNATSATMVQNSSKVS